MKLTLAIPALALVALTAGSCQSDEEGADAMDKSESETSSSETVENYSIEVTRGENDLCPLDETVEKLKSDPKYLADLREQSTDNRKIRVVGMNQAMTMDFRPDRLTVTVDDENKVLKLRCV